MVLFEVLFYKFFERIFMQKHLINSLAGGGGTQCSPVISKEFKVV
ncbi:hypothetical protein [Campylobacter upsaliensis]|nr:hypothetical protein [Campylobacter upsaliensis]